MKLRSSPSQYIDTITLVRCLKRAEQKIRSGRPCRQAQYVCEWIQNELERRAAEAQRIVALRA